MKKTYKCKLSMLGLLVNIDGASKRLDFIQSTVTGSGLVGCLYTTSDKKEQLAIEAHERFNSGYKNQVWTDDVEEVEEPASYEKDGVMVFNCTTVKEAQAILEAEPYNLPHSEVTSKVKIFALQKELGVSFPNL